MEYTIRAMKPADAGQVNGIQVDYLRSHLDPELVSPEMYLSAFFRYGANVFCGVDGDRVLGFAALNANLVTEPGIPHTVWARIMTSLGLPEADEVIAALLERVSARAREIGAAVPGHETRLTFQFYASEVEGVAFAESIGCRYVKTGYRMQYDLSRTPPVPLVPPGIEVRATRLETAVEQESYAAERSRAFPRQPITVTQWRDFAASPAFRGGTTFTAFANGGVVGSVAAYCEEGQRVGYTEDIFVKEGWRRRGIAHYLIARSLAYLMERGFRGARLDVDADNTEALGVYRGMGYAVVGESRIYVLTL